MQTVKDAANYVSDTVQGAGAGASKEANKEVAKSDEASISTRATAAKDAVSDKLDQSKHDTSGELNKQKVQHS